jgi:type I thyroxine 5'-deiodinase
VEFCLIYVREAHPSDGPADAFIQDFRQINLEEGIDIRQHATAWERAAAAQQMCRKLALRMPTLIDDIENPTELTYSAYPDRLYLVDREGRIAYKGRRGPEGFDPQELEDAIRTELRASTPAGDQDGNAGPSTPVTR